jgi:hypothetical protein
MSEGTPAPLARLPGLVVAVGRSELFFEPLKEEEAADVIAAMKEVAREGLDADRHLRGEVYEVRAA